MDVNHLIIFKNVVECGGFSAAAATLRLPKSSVSQKVSQLEHDLGVRLLQRTTRRVSLTEVGEKVYDATLRIAAETDEIASLVNETFEEPTGLLRISAPHDLGAYVIGRVLKPFVEKHPAVTLEMDLSLRYVDLVKEGFDLALRASGGPLKESSLVARALLTTRMKIYASPAWIKTHGRPRTPDDLKGQNAAHFAPSTRRISDVWKLTTEDGRHAEISVRPVLRANDFITIKQATLSGVGIGIMPEVMSFDEVERKELVMLLPEWESGRANFHAVYPSRKHVPAKTRAFVEFLKDRIGKDRMPCPESPLENS